ncbi:cupin domain-containing protein [Lysobacter sp. K5869]|uniref:cupin domain-containing protein n=1 Tax=Lysobacter sp. K5869 TaxID=2820808 RepID=UPI001C063749|nr:cupin domain-containing protein [Lysobacter sp. K5869]QWP75292.1 cupin domain-containing protein [Lysobacter sp. K5869]
MAIRSLVLGTLAVIGAAEAAPPPTKERCGSYVQRAADIAIEEPGPHEGAGRTTAYPFFADACGFRMAFRQRVLHPGATIGEHLNDKDEIYYVLSGRGSLFLDGSTREVQAGDAVLTRKGSRHGLKQVGRENLVIIVAYQKP